MGSNSGARFGSKDGLKMTANQWTVPLSDDLQEAVDAFCIDDLCRLNFSVTIADPALPDCPLVACSAGFTEMTGYSVEETVGRNCRFLMQGVPYSFLDKDVAPKCRAFYEAVRQGEVAMVDSTDSKGMGPDSLGLSKPCTDFPKGECICVQTNARKDGELFRNLFHMKAVELDGNVYILALQAELKPDEKVKANSQLKSALDQAFESLAENLVVIEEILAQEFWYSTSMRRQV